eukprot:5327830-Alexandrium_andersonii.AAC.1
MAVIRVSCRYRRHTMVVTIMMVMARRPTSARTRSLELLRCPFCIMVRAKREMATSPELPKAR